MNLNVCIALNDGIKLELWPDGQWESKLGRNINVELVLLLLRLQTLHVVQIPRISLTKQILGASSFTRPMHRAHSELYRACTRLLHILHIVLCLVWVMEVQTI